jgi:uncharacterized protein (TIGR03437 family)
MRDLRPPIGVSILIVLTCGAFPLAAQLPSNSTIKGAYGARYLGAAGSGCRCPLSFSGNVIFDGSGGYQINGQSARTDKIGNATTTTVNTAGTYSVQPSGAFTMDNPFAVPRDKFTVLYGGVGSGAIVASSTDSGYGAAPPYLDTFIAIPAATSASNATLKGKYQMAHLEFLNGSLTATRDTFFSINPDGAGSLANVTITGTAQSLQDVATSQTSLGASYTVTANGSGSMTFPAPASISATDVLLSGNKTLYVSQDGNVLIAGSPAGYDLEVAVKAIAGSPAYKGLYFMSQLENFAARTSFDGLYGYQGAFNVLGDSLGNELVHLRLNRDGFFSYDWTYRDNFVPDLNGIYAGSFYQSAIGAGGNLLIQAGTGSDYLLTVGVKLPAAGARAGVFLDPTGIQNAASNAPFTAQVSPGEILSLYGSGLAANTVGPASAPFPNALGNVSVTIDGKAAPVYYVSPGQLNVVVPYGVHEDGSLLPIQVTNNGVTSNVAFEYSGSTSPGIFTVPAGGIGAGAIFHSSNFSLVSASNPAKAGEAVSIFVTGLGDVSPVIAAGNAAPIKPLSNVVDGFLNVRIDGLSARIQYAGLAPTLGGIYQVNVFVPATVNTGSARSLEISTIDGDNIQTTIPVTQ